MANHVWQRVTVNSEKEEVHRTLEKWWSGLDYNDVKGVVEPVFGKDFKYDTNTVGSKWAVTTVNPTRSQLQTVGN